ncbi:M23 family metallopeptidase [Paenibacillus soyae]|uniref:M23 family metallopeptidase n=1 Tax=Paenibacillus soyae TaxID=2969249 RepID=A0A9X2MLP7_9BACL|nr:M23 family metallopeptidase [Paenibacillus soyae]MCR2802635.1 M23 family metallopeptidase [Paenibacillus soyae]
MGVRDDVKLRRQEKIRSLLHQYQERPQQTEISIPQPKRGRPSGVAPESEALLDEQDSWRSAPDWAAMQPELTDPKPGARRSRPEDPELAWKKNPNPWAGWDNGSPSTSGARSFVKSQHTDDFEPPEGGGWGSLRKSFAWKLILSAALFGGIWMMFELDHPLAQQGQQFVKEAMTDEMNFDAVALWYKDVFAGAPSFIPIFEERGGGAALVDGEPNTPVVAPIEEAVIVRTFAELLNGIELAGESGAPVVAVETGRVIQVTEKGDSILIQHANDRITIYGKLGTANVAVNDWVEAGQQIGSLQTAVDGEQSFLHFAVKQNDRYMDPLDVIPID